MGLKNVKTGLVLALIFALSACVGGRHGRDDVQDLVDSMSLEEKVGQLFMIGISGPVMDELTVSRILDLHVGSFILFTKNCPDPQSVAGLTADLQSTAYRTGHEIPILVAVDQEQGRVMRLTRGMTLFPANYGFGRLGDPAAVRKAAEITAAELAAVGISLNLAPVADVNSNPDNPIIGVRSFGESPEKAAEMVRAAVHGYNGARLGSSVKHFPGHGDVDMDSHLDLPVLHKTLAELEAVELVPFRAGIEAQVPMVMTAHILYPALDPGRPATASRAILQDLLRGELAFTGVVVSDALDMQALSKHFDLPSLTVEIVNAGCDLLIFSENLPNPYTFEDLHQAVLEAARSGAVSKDRLDEAVSRILSFKKQYVTFPLPAGELDAVLRTPKHVSFSREVTKRILATNQDAFLFPVSVDPGQTLLVTDSSRFLDFFRHTDIEAVLLTDSSDVDHLARAVDRVQDVWAFCSSDKTVELLGRALPENGKNVRLFSLNDPYLKSALPFQVSTYLNIYGQWVSLRAVREFCIGSYGESSP